MRIKKVEISADVEAVLRAGSWRGPVFILPDGQLARPLYVAVDKVLKALGGKWNKGAGGHAFADDKAAELLAALDAGAIIDTKKTLEQFFTPPWLAKKLAAALNPKPGSLVLEPSAGGGALVVAALDRDCLVHAIEIDRGLWGNLLIMAEGRSGLVALLADFTKFESPLGPIYDAVIMNPPFGNGADMAHVRRAFGMLRTDGRLGAIMSPHWTFAENAAAREFRDWVTGLIAAGEAYWTEIEGGAFRESGTMVRTGMLIARKAG